MSNQVCVCSRPFPRDPRRSLQPPLSLCPPQEQGSPAALPCLSWGSTGGAGAGSSRFPAVLEAVRPAHLALPGLSL